MMRHLFSILFLSLISNLVFGNQNIDSLLIVLDNEIENKNIYHQNKVNHIDSIKHSLDLNRYDTDTEYRMAHDQKLFEEYKSFIYDSAFSYASKTLITAFKTGDENHIATAKLNLGFTLLSAGLFSETLDSLLTINKKNIDNSLLVDYYALLGRTYFDLADYSEDVFYTPTYEKIGQSYHDSALMICQPNSKCYYSLTGLKNLRLGNITNALRVYSFLMTNFNLSKHEVAVEASSMAHIYRLAGQHDKADYMLALAAIADIKSSTKETIALRNLAEHLFQIGDIERAYQYINLALDDAYFFEARHRKVKISDILPHIEKEIIRASEQKKKVLIYYSIATSILSILVLVLAGIVFKSLKKLRTTRNQLIESNNAMQKTNSNLHEANKIKEEYIGHFLNLYSEHIDKLEKLKKSISRRLATNSYRDISDVIRSIDLKKEREALYTDFDNSFLKIFPNFINEFNALFNDEDKIVLDNNQILSPEIRIFALIRLGIKENERIAQVLNYSLNTIYTYKTKIKNKSIVSNEEFEDKIMEIRAV